MKRNIILSAVFLLLCLAVIYILFNRSRYPDLNIKLGLQQNKIINLIYKLNQSKEINEKRKARIQQLTNRYPSGIWECDNDADRIVFKQEINKPTLNKIIEKLNKVNRSSKEPIIIFIKRDKNDVYLTVKDSEQLTERMGSAGARCYLGVIVYSITSIENIDTVIFEFNKGSHAAPGKYSRIDFEP